MIPLDDATLRRLQLAELELLEEADRICRKCGIHYNIIAGTLLGAVRHGGFIPWDDDADIALLRPEYERFREAVRNELDTERFLFQDIEETPGYRWGYGKLRLKDSLFLREYQEDMPYHQGVFLDVFPLDPVPESHTGRTFLNVRCFFLRKLLWSKVGRKAHKNALMRKGDALLALVPERWLVRRYRRLVNACARRADSSWVRILMFPTPNREWGYRRCWYEHSASILFEGQEFSGIADADAYLTFKYGDYRTLPPESGRKTHPVTAIRLPEDL